jgi:hypothetical protein
VGGEIAVDREGAADRHDDGQGGDREADSMDGIAHE